MKKPYCIREIENSLKTGFFYLAAFSPEGLYIGEPDFASRLVRQYGILTFFGRRQDSTVATIGFSPLQKKWYGWSHRAIFGFGLGDKLFSSRYGDENTKFHQHGTKVIKTLKEAREAARRFAEYV